MHTTVELSVAKQTKMTLNTHLLASESCKQNSSSDSNIDHVPCPGRNGCRNAQNGGYDQYYPVQAAVPQIISTFHLASRIAACQWQYAINF